MVGFIILGGLVGVGITAAVSRRSLGHAEDDMLTGIKLQGIYTIYAVILGFVIFSAWQFYLQASESVRDEAAAVVTIIRDAKSLPDGAGDEVLHALNVYLTATLETEWASAPANGTISDQAGEALQELTNQITALKGDESVSNVQYQLLSAAGVLDQARSDRVFYAENEDPDFVWVLLAFGGLAVLVLSASLHYRSRKLQMIMVGSLGAIISLALFSVWALDHPYTGPFPIGPGPLQAGQALVNTY